MTQVPMASVGFKKRKNIGAVKQRTGITSTKSAQEVGEHAEAGFAISDGDVKESNLIDAKASSSSSSPHALLNGDGESKIAATFESSGNAMPQSYAGDANNALRQETEANKSNGGIVGPQKAPEFVRMTCRFDYQPDICKDYKETGFCGYGDNCKFMHDRGDYKSGWQLEKEWDDAQARKKKKLEESLKGFDFADGENNKNGGEDDEEENWEIDLDEELPFACLICRDEFKDPVITLCGHYFCSKCAVARHQKNSKCAACSKQTMGVFNVAHKIIKQMAVRDALKNQNKNGTNVCVEIEPKVKGTWE